MPDLRLFYACPLPETMVPALTDLQARLRRSGWKGRLSARTAWHVTLLFLGGTAPELLPDLLSAGAAAARTGGPVPICVERLVAFPSLRRPRVVAAELDDAAGLLARVRAVLTEELHLIDERAFRPHITLLRVGSSDAPHPLPDTAADAAGILDRLVLYQSTLLPDGARYETRGAWPLSPVGG